MERSEEYKKGYMAAVANAAEYLQGAFLYVPEDDNPHIESTKIMNMQELTTDFLRSMKKKM